MTPLSGIVLWCEILRGRHRLPKVLDHAIMAIDRGARTQVAILDNFVELSLAQAGATELARAPVDLAASVRDAVRRNGSGADAREVRLRFVPPDPACVVEGDAFRLRNALSNVVDNAVKASPPGGHVEIVLEHASPTFAIRVTDQGPGIPLEARPTLFTLPEITEAGVSKRRGGLGLGLPIAHRIVELHGGTIVVADVAPTGCAVTITLPASAA